MPAQLRHALDAERSTEMAQEVKQGRLSWKLFGQSPGGGIHTVHGTHPDGLVQPEGRRGAHLLIIAADD